MATALCTTQLFAVYLLLTAAAATATAANVNEAEFKAIEGFDCVRPEFIETHCGLRSEYECAGLCNVRPRCQAFTFSTLCRLFVFDKCSKDVRDCSCTAKAQIFVKQQKGLGAGLLCPTGYGNDRCGVKYRVENVSRNWTDQKAVCDSDGGLSMMADAIDVGEMQHLASIVNGTGDIFHIGGEQQVNSDEPDSGWNWICGQAVNASLWSDAEPNNSNGIEDKIDMRTSDGKLNDLKGAAVARAMCECVSPFN